jgi:hypothetical protein
MAAVARAAVAWAEASVAALAMENRGVEAWVAEETVAESVRGGSRSSRGF